jgi:hypothetical protein
MHERQSCQHVEQLFVIAGSFREIDGLSHQRIRVIVVIRAVVGDKSPQTTRSTIGFSTAG